MTRYEKIVDCLENMTDDEIIKLHNEYCQNNCCYDDVIYSMDDFDEIMGNQSAWDVARAAYFGNFSPMHEYWKFNAYGNLKSFYNAYEAKEDEICIDEIATYIDENEDYLYNDELKEILTDDGNEEGGE